jgi:hypothetical protein
MNSSCQDTSTCSSGPCFVYTSRCSTGLCSVSVDTYKCNSGPFGVDMLSPAQTPDVQIRPDAAQDPIFLTRPLCSSGPCQCKIDKSRSSKDFCNLNMSRCSSGHFSVDTSIGTAKAPVVKTRPGADQASLHAVDTASRSTDSFCPEKSRCRSGPCGVGTSKCRKSFCSVYTSRKLRTFWCRHVQEQPRLLLSRHYMFSTNFF